MAENGTIWQDLGYFRRLVMVSTDNVFVFSASGCSRRRDRGRIPSKLTGFLADLKYCCRSARLADWRQLGPAAMLVRPCHIRHVARNGDTARLETCATSTFAAYRSHCSRRGPVCWLGRPLLVQCFAGLSPARGRGTLRTSFGRRGCEAAPRPRFLRAQTAARRAIHRSWGNCRTAETVRRTGAWLLPLKT